MITPFLSYPNHLDKSLPVVGVKPLSTMVIKPTRLNYKNPESKLKDNLVSIYVTINFKILAKMLRFQTENLLSNFSHRELYQRKE